VNQTRFTRIALLGAFAFVVGRSSASAQTRSLPDSLNDREFWQLFTSASETGGTFASENFVSNEKTFQYVIPTLQKTLKPGGVYLGVGPEQNFTYIANLSPKLAVIFDIRRENALLQLMYKALFEISPTRAEFVARLFSRPLTMPNAVGATPAEIFGAVEKVASTDSAFDANWKAIVTRLSLTRGLALSTDDRATMRRTFQTFREAGPGISYAYHLGLPPTSTPYLVTFAELQSLTNASGENMAFLATEASYGRVRSMQLRNLIVPVVGDFAGAKAIRAVAEYLTVRRATVSAFYVSNVEQYLFGGFSPSYRRFYENVAALPIDSASVFIRSVPGPGPMPVLPPSFMTEIGSGGSVRIQSTDSGGVRIFTATGTDSAGKTFSKRTVVPFPPQDLASTSAFISGLANIRGTLDAYAAERLTTYTHVQALTKTDGWER
jgi:hypothetical protein